MPPRRLSREEKGKAIVVASCQTEDTTANGTPLDEFTLLHRDAMRDSENMDLSQRLLVAHAHRMIREEGENQGESSEQESGSSEREDQRNNETDEEDESDEESSGDSLSIELIVTRHDVVARCDWNHVYYHAEGIFEDLPPLDADRICDPRPPRQDWDNVFGTCSTHKSVQELLRANSGHGVTYIIPSSEQRPWSPLIGF